MPDSPADPFLVVPQADPFARLTDGGPRYQETPFDPYDLPPGTIAEPYNTATAALFIVIVLLWAWRLRGRYRQYAFITCMLPILLAGGIGGTLYHALRNAMAWFLLDVVPIQILGLAASIYLSIRLGRVGGWKRISLLLGGVLLASVAFNAAFRWVIPLKNPNIAVNISYLTLAAIVIVPMVAFLWRTRFRHVGWVLAGLACFGHAWFFRLVDNTGLVNLPMGTHWLWHTYGAATTMFLFEYFYRVISDDRAAV
jgi:hypothetical protein